MPTTMNKSVREAAQDLVTANVAAEPAIVKAYLFPSDKEIRLVYVDPTTSPLQADERIAPYYFGASKDGGLPYTSAIAIVLPKEEGHARLPEEWEVVWEDGEVVWRK